MATSSASSGPLSHTIGPFTRNARLRAISMRRRTMDPRHRAGPPESTGFGRRQLPYRRSLPLPRTRRCAFPPVQNDDPYASIPKDQGPILASMSFAPMCTFIIPYLLAENSHRNCKNYDIPQRPPAMPEHCLVIFPRLNALAMVSNGRCRFRLRPRGHRSAPADARLRHRHGQRGAAPHRRNRAGILSSAHRQGLSGIRSEQSVQHFERRAARTCIP